MFLSWVCFQFDCTLWSNSTFIGFVETITVLQVTSTLVVYDEITALFVGGDSDVIMEEKFRSGKKDKAKPSNGKDNMGSEQSGWSTSDDDDKKKRKKNGREKVVNVGSDSSEDFVLASKLKSSRGKKRKKSKKVSSSDGDGSGGASTDENSDEKDRPKPKKRRRIKKNSSSEEEEGEKAEGEGEGEDGSPSKGRKHIRKIISDKKVGKAAKEANQVERERRKRMEERQEKYNAIFKV